MTKIYDLYYVCSHGVATDAVPECDDCRFNKRLHAIVYDIKHQNDWCLEASREAFYMAFQCFKKAFLIWWRQQLEHRTSRNQNGTDGNVH